MVVRMAYPYYAPYVPLPYDLFLMMPTMFYWMVLPYYYMMYLEIFRAAIEAWRKAFESIGKTVAPTKE
ncbi:hypothetical protein DRN86_04795 [Candidatus Geothermarchaeota archaeon]|nr:MAG: hypothetical protein DRN86_04795 [Candidatus Geothermarchaeota archaeon]